MNTHLTMLAIGCLALFAAPYASGADKLDPNTPAKSLQLFANRSFALADGNHDDKVTPDELAKVRAALENRVREQIVAGTFEGPFIDALPVAPARDPAANLDLAAFRAMFQEIVKDQFVAAGRPAPRGAPAPILVPVAPVAAVAPIAVARWPELDRDLTPSWTPALSAPAKGGNNWVSRYGRRGR